MPRLAVASILIYAVYWALKAFTLHHVGNYAVETDFYWKYGPGADGLRHGRVLIEDFDSKGFGYPLVVAAVSLLGFDLFRAAQLVGLLSACAAAWLVFSVSRRLLGATLGLFCMLLLLANRAFLVNTYEVGTDMFFFAVAMGSIALLLREDSGWKSLAESGLLAGWAFATRYNGLFLWLGALAVLLWLRPRPAAAAERLREAALWTGAFLAGAAPWLLVNAAHTGNPLTNNNYTNVGYAVYGEGNWEKFFYGSERPIHSFADVVRLDPKRFALAMAKNAAEHVKRDLTELLPLFWGILAVLGAVLVALERRGRAWGVFLLFGALYFLTLVPVFWGARFSMALLPFYAALAIGTFAWRPVHAFLAPAERMFPVRPFLFLLLWMATSFPAYQWTEDFRNPEAIQAGPYETLGAAEYLKEHARGEALLARKPHVAFIAGMRFVPIPDVGSPDSLHAEAQKAGARFLLVSGAEMALREAVRPFAEPNAAVPGFRRVYESQGALVYEVLPEGP